jgi:hypothetical protein
MMTRRQPLTLLISILVVILTILTHPTKAQISEKLWHELGRGIGNEGLGDLAGYTVATSASGDIVAVASPLHDTLSTSTDPNVDNSKERAGRVRVYRYNSRQNGWKKIGQDIGGEEYGDEFGKSLHLSEDGYMIAIGSPMCEREEKEEVGCVAVYQLETIKDDDASDDEKEDTWMMVGHSLYGEHSFDHFGTSVAIETFYDDERATQSILLAIGAPGNSEVGKVYLYTFAWSVTVLWTKSTTITDTDPFPFSRFGSSISMTKDTKNIAIGAPNHGDGYPGAIRVFNRDNDEKTWEPVALPSNIVDTHEINNKCGTSVSFEKTGKYLAYGCPEATISDKFSVGKVNVLRNTKNSDDGTLTWTNNVLVGEKEGDLFGSSIQLSDLTTDGNIFIAIGAPKNSPTRKTRNAGHIRVYYSEEDSNTWKQAGLDVNGLSSNDLLGSSVGISAEGHVVVSGAPDGGYAKIYLLDTTAPPSLAPTLPPVNLDEKRRSSVWIVFVISIFSSVLIFASFMLLAKLRRRGKSYDSSLQGIRTRDIEDDVGTEMTTTRPKIAGYNTEPRDII